MERIAAFAILKTTGSSQLKGYSILNITLYFSVSQNDLAFAANHRYLLRSFAMSVGRNRQSQLLEEWPRIGQKLYTWATFLETVVKKHAKTFNTNEFRLKYSDFLQFVSRSKVWNPTGLKECYIKSTTWVVWPILVELAQSHWNCPASAS